MFGCKYNVMNFGFCDLFISNDSNLNTQSLSNLGDCYILLNGFKKESEDVKKYIAGSYFLKIIEVCSI